jgi:hypothetical protein
MWKSSWHNDPLRYLRRKIEGRDENESPLPIDDQGIPDLLADNEHLANIGMVRDSVRSLLREARRFDRQRNEVQEACFLDTERPLKSTARSLKAMVLKKIAVSSPVTRKVYGHELGRRALWQVRVHSHPVLTLGPHRPPRVDR